MVEPLPGCGSWLLLFDIAAVAPTASGQSFIDSRGPGMKAGTPVGCFEWRLE